MKNMLKRVRNFNKRYYKKRYRYGWKENVFTLFFCLTLIFSVNIATMNFPINRNLVYLICSITLGFLGMWLFYHANFYAKKKQMNILSQNSKRRLRAFNHYIWAIYPVMLFGFFIFKESRAFAPIGLTLMWLMAMKSFLFDNIIYFGKSKYFSGFDEVELNKIIKLEKMPEGSFGFVGMVSFQLLEADKVIGWDKFYADDFEILWEMYAKIE